MGMTPGAHEPRRRRHGGSRDRSDQGRGKEVYVWEGGVGMCWGGVGMCGDGVGMCGDYPGAHEPRGGVTWAPETGQTRWRGEEVGRGRDVWG